MSLIEETGQLQFEWTAQGVYPSENFVTVLLCGTCVHCFMLLLFSVNVCVVGVNSPQRVCLAKCTVGCSVHDREWPQL